MVRIYILLMNLSKYNSLELYPKFQAILNQYTIGSQSLLVANRTNRKVEKTWQINMRDYKILESLTVLDPERSY